MSTHNDKLSALVQRPIAGSGICIAAAIAAMEERVGQTVFIPRDDDDRYNWFAEAYPRLKEDLPLFSHGQGKEIDADAGLGMAGLEVVNALLERAKAKERLKYTGDELSAYLGAFCTFAGNFKDGFAVKTAQVFAEHGVVGAALSAGSNTIEFYQGDGAEAAIVTDSNGDSVMLYSVATPIELRHEFGQTFSGYPLVELVRKTWKRVERAGIAFPSASIDIEPDVSYFVGGQLTVGGVKGTFVQALSQARFLIDHRAYKAEVVFAAAVQLEAMVAEPGIDGYMVISPAASMGVVLHRPKAKHSHFGAIIPAANFQKN
jgi:hypothetical protein